MHKILSEAETYINYYKNYEEGQRTYRYLKMDEAIANCAVKASFDLNASLIVVYTRSGKTAKSVAKFKPKCPILAVTNSAESGKQCMLYKGIFFMIVDSLMEDDHLHEKVFSYAKSRNLVSPGDYVILTAGFARDGGFGTTNLLRIETIKADLNTSSSTAELSNE